MRCILPAASLCVVLSWLGSASGAEPARVVWHTDFQAARQESVDSGLPLLVHFYGTNCPPCRQMEAEVFRSAEFQKAMAGGFVLVKLESRKDRALLDQFEIRSIPADLVLSPDNRILWSHEGYQSGDRWRYVGAVSQYRGQLPVRELAEQAPDPRRSPSNSAESKRQSETSPAQRSPEAPVAKRTPKSTSEETIAQSRGKTPARAEAALRDQPSKTRGEETSRFEDASSQSEVEQWAAAAPPSQKQQTESSRSLAQDTKRGNRPPTRPVARSDWALDGYSPVSLKESGKWLPGLDEFTAEYDGLTYRFVDAEERERFLKSPEQFAVQEGGRDVVVWDEVHKQLAGSTRFAAYYNGQLYLFYSRESRAQFKKNPARYARGRQAAWQIHPSEWGVRLLE
jgi:YHS domain-containing protein/thiol-disulfide isomerase/thioredoxin